MEASTLAQRSQFIFSVFSSFKKKLIHPIWDMLLTPLAVVTKSQTSLEKEGLKTWREGDHCWRKVFKGNQKEWIWDQRDNWEACYIPELEHVFL